MIHRRRHLPIVGRAIISALLFSLLSNLMLLAQDSPIPAREVRVLESTELGLAHPTGVAFAPERDEFFVLEGFIQGQAQPQPSAFTVINTLDEVIDRQQTERTLNPRNLAYDRTGKRLLLLNTVDHELLAVDWQGADAPDLSTVVTYGLPVLTVDEAQGMAVDAQTQTLYLLNPPANEIIALELPSMTAQSSGLSAHIRRTIRLQVNATAQLRGLAIHPQTGHLFTLDTQAWLLNEFSTSGELVESYDLSQTTLGNPQSLVFAPSADLTDDPTEMSLFVADSGAAAVVDEPVAPTDQPFSLYLPLVTGGNGNQAIRNPPQEGRLVELSLEPLVLPVHSASVTAGNLVRTIDTSSWPSPDPSGIAYLAPSSFVNNTNRFLIVDGEVEEMAIYDNANVFEMNVAGQLVQTHTIHGVFSSEPTGAAFNPNNGHLFISDDDKRSIWEVVPGPDKLLFTDDDTRTRTIVTDFGGRDAEGLAYGLVGGVTPTVFMADGENHEVQIIKLGADGVLGGGDDVVTHFDTESLGILDPEGIEYNPANNHIYLAAFPSTQVAELTPDGVIVQLIDVSAANLDKPAGLAIGPSSQNPAIMNLYIVDRGVDNNSDSDENDGKVYEIALPTGGNQPPIVSAGADQSVELPAGAVLTATVSDDGLPNPPATVTTTWSKVSGPGTVTFANGNALNTTATFSAAGVYVLQLTASDGAFTVSDTVTVTVTANQPPTVNAGADQTVILSAGTQLTATVSDDGLPNPPAAVTVTWSMVSGPGVVTFANPNATATSVTFSTPGSYTLRLTASDSVLSATDDIVITVELANQPPTVNVGADQTVAVNQAITLTATITDDGLPNPPSNLSLLWEKVDGPGAVTFGNAEGAGTTASFDTVGVYTLQLTANDGEFSAQDEVVVTVKAANSAPTVDAGDDQTVNSGEIVTLTGVVSDDGLPNPPGQLTVAWQQVSGPDTALLTDADKAQATATFPTAGVYVLRLTASDAELSASDEVTITVKAANPAPVVELAATRVVTLTELEDTVLVTATITDDSRTDELTITWSLVSGSGDVTFGTPHAASTTVHVTQAGEYILQVMVSDGENTTTKTMTLKIVVAIDGGGTISEFRVFMPLIQQ